MRAAAAIFLSVIIATTFPARGADYFSITDPHMAEYIGFWSGNKGTKGRLTAQIRPLSNNQYDGFILFSRVKTPVTVFKLKPAPAENGVIKFTASSVTESTVDLIGENEATCELRDGKITGTFKGDSAKAPLTLPGMSENPRVWAQNPRSMRSY